MLSGAIVHVPRLQPRTSATKALVAAGGAFHTLSSVVTETHPIVSVGDRSAYCLDVPAGLRPMIGSHVLEDDVLTDYNGILCRWISAEDKVYVQLLRMQ